MEYARERRQSSSQIHRRLKQQAQLLSAPQVEHNFVTHANPTNMASLDGKVIAITGGASGIGLATAHLLVARGAAVSIVDVQEDNLTAASEAIKKATPNAKIHSKKVNVASSQEVETWLDEVVSQFGKIDGAANLAGVTGKTTSSAFTADVDEDDFDFIISVNLKGVFNCLKAELKRMKGGSIVNASSVAGTRGYYKSVAYCASKVCTLHSTLSRRRYHHYLRWLI